MAGANVETIAKALNITPRRVQQLVNDGMPRGKRGEYDLGACLVWYVRFLQRALEARHDPETRDDSAELMRDRGRLARAQADKTEIENAVRCGELSVTARIVEWYGGMVADAKNRLLQIPDAIGQQLDPETARKVVALARRLIHEALAELARGEPPADGGDSGAVGAAAGLDGEPVGGPVPPAVERGKRRARNLAN
jgi:phage terminase Nu1 subunit (DNA packaging protein)